MTNKKMHQQSLRIPKGILVTAKVLEQLSTGLAVKFAAKLFTTPIKHKLPKREFEMFENAVKSDFLVEKLNTKIKVYEYGKSDKKVLLVHGWSGRGTQLVKIADELLKLGYATVSFDAPAHGKSPGKSSDMTQFIASVLELDQKFGPFEFAVGHSLGGMTVMNALTRGLQLKKAVIIGSGDVVQDIFEDFVAKIQLQPKVAKKMVESFEQKIGETMSDYSTYVNAKKVEIPVLVMHDEDDYDVPVTAAINIEKNLQNGELFLTKGLGHRKILGDTKVLKKMVEFLKD
ncbi:alpha/beta fold hydrolase [Flavobacterium sp. NST-5]|uniref:Alpha/beta fold hydrolase n=1 Tax=Flavobacterium ichthyis TaxID=2698827 RepID=A0ABW9ZAR2_9FLAO|nr:alpha/beta hydrolase [Flavobacterium ichthyis]NBL65991.1 alpha/beta fold hydrolase [Flavobacterium ichthyis]